jgi:hypothetical protein
MQVYIADLGGGVLEACFLDFGKEPVIAIQERLPAIATEARRLEGMGYELMRRPMWTGTLLFPIVERHIMFRVQRLEDVDPCSVGALRLVLREERPEWVKAIRECKGLSDDPEVIVAACGLPLQVVAACLSMREEWDFWDQEPPEARAL